MATDFFERQAEARQSTKWLIGLFVLGVLGIVGATFVAAFAGMGGIANSNRLSPQRQNLPDPLVVALGASGASLALIGGGTLFKTAQLRAGGTVVAEDLGGRRVYPDSADAVERRLLNVVEEMALASGVPAPPVFLLGDEQGINAFAAGYSPSDAVVAVTRGCAEHLTREELQGVVAHEFSHILNGDMRLNIRLIGVLHGILLLGLLGRILLRLSYSSRGGSRNKGNGAWFVAVGIAMVVLGYLGTLMGSLIKAAVSRQREFLADASAVQFTRNPEGLAGALKRIGALALGSRVTAPRAAEASHMFFAQGVWEGFTSLTATHPPLPERIRRLDPQWDGKFLVASRSSESTTPLSRAGFHLPEAASGFTGGDVELGKGEGDADEAPLEVVRRAADQVGEPTEVHRLYAAELIASMPNDVIASARETYGARAVVFGLLADRDADVRARQLARLDELAPADVVRSTRKLLPALDALDARMRLPLVDLTLPALRAMSAPQYTVFVHCFRELVYADERLGLFEWTLHRVLLRHLTPQFEKRAAPRVAYYALSRLANECSVLLSTLALADNRRADAPAALARAAAELPGVHVEMLDADQCGLEPLRRALDQLARVASKQRRLVVVACAACICADREVTVAEAELLRGICDMLDCPLPPLLPGQPLEVTA